MNEIINKINNYQKEIYKLEKSLNKLKEETLWSNYDEHQQAVIKDESNVILVEAYPGSGKTHTLLGRVQRLVNQDPLLLNKMIIITFTKKAGEELRSKISQLIPGANPYFVGTFHGLAYRELSKLSEKGLSLLDQTDEQKLIKQVCETLVKNGEINRNSLNIISKYGDNAYQTASTCYPLNLKKYCKKNGLVKYEEELHLLIEEYRKEKERTNSLDFNDLMVQFYLNLVDNKLGNLESINYIFFDEYQDVNPIQNQILKEFYQRGINLMVVGDPRQSIYSFRGSEVSFINNFEKDFPEVSKFTLTNNYRSSSDIVSLCNNIFDRECKMNATNQKYKLPKIKVFRNFKQEQKYIIDSIVEKINLGCSLSKITILTRKNNVLNQLEEDLIRRKIPYLKNGGQSLLEKPHIKNLLSFLTILYYPENTFHWKQILKLHRGIGNVKTDMIINKCKKLPDDLEQFKFDKHLINIFNFCVNNIQ